MQTKRGRAGVPARPLSKRFVRSASGGSIQIVIAHDRPRILALGRNVAVDELDERHRRPIRRADAGLDDAGIAALQIGAPRAEHVHTLGVQSGNAVWREKEYKIVLYLVVGRYI